MQPISTHTKQTTPTLQSNKREREESISKIYENNKLPEENNKPPELSSSKRFKASAHNSTDEQHNSDYANEVSNPSPKIKKKEQGPTSLFLAVFNKEWKVVSELLKCNPDVNATLLGIYEGKTPLFLAALAHKWDIVSTMLKYNPDVNATPTKGIDQGTTPLFFAVLAQQWNIVSEMLKYNPDVNVSPAAGPYQGHTPLFLAISAHQWEISLKMATISIKQDLLISPKLACALKECFRNYEEEIEGMDVRNKLYYKALMTYIVFTVNKNKLDLNEASRNIFHNIRKEIASGLAKIMYNSNEVLLLKTLPQELQVKILLESMRHTFPETQMLEDSFLDNLIKISRGLL